MTTVTDYELSRKYFFYHKDGLLDIFAGLGILLAGAGMLAGMFWLAGAWVAVFVPTWVSARKSITYRRASDVEEVPEQNSRYSLPFALFMGVLILFALVGFTFLMWFDAFPAFRELLSNSLLLVIGAGMALFLAIVAASMRLPRYYAYAGLAVLVFAAGQVLGWEFWVPLMVVGGLIALLGMLILIRFIQQHPIQR